MNNKRNKLVLVLTTLVLLLVLALGSVAPGAAAKGIEFRPSAIEGWDSMPVLASPSAGGGSGA